MDFHNRLLRITTEAIVGKAIRDIKKDANRSIRKGIDLGNTFARGELQKEFFELAGEIASSPQNPYNQLIKRGVGTIDDDIFRTVGVNLGMTSFTFGAHQIRAEYAESGRSLSWLRKFDFSAPEKIIREKALKLRMERCLRKGVCAFWFQADACREALGPVLDAASWYGDCTFFLAAEPDGIRESEAERILSLKNIVIFVPVRDAGTKKAEAFRILRKYRLLYGFLLYYGAEKTADTSEEFLKEMIDCGCFAGVYDQTDSGPEENYPVYNFVCAARRQGVQPILLFDYHRDAAYIQDLILLKRHFTGAHADPLNV